MTITLTQHPAVARGVKATLLALALTLPLALLELATLNPRFSLSRFPVFLFVVLWVFAWLFSFSALFAVRLLREGLTFVNVYLLGVALVGAGAMAWAWLSLVADQMPCFLGATGC